MRVAVTLLALTFAGAAWSQALQPGEWEFTSIISSPLLPKPRSVTVRQCVKQEDAANLERWMGRNDGKSDCQFTHGKKGADTATWEVTCPKTNMRGSGSARIGRDTVESDMRMSGDAKGRKFEMRTKMSGRRLGPCKS